MRILLLALLLSSLVAAIGPTSFTIVIVSTSSTTNPYIQEFLLPRPQTIPGPIAVAPNGTVWFAETNASSLAKFDPSQGFTEFAFRNSPTYILPQDAARSINSVATDSHGNVWFTLSSSNAFGYFNTTSRTFNYYNLTMLTGRNYNSFPYGITVDSNEIAWVAETGASRIARLDPSNGSFHEYVVPQPNAAPIEIFIDPNHTLWITSYWYTNSRTNAQSGSTLTKFNPATDSTIQQSNQYNLSAVGILTPVGVVVDANGHAWIGDHAGSWLGDVNTATGEVKLHRTSLPPLNPHPQNLTDRIFDASITLVNDVVLGTDGTPWFIEHIGGRIGHYIPANDTLIEYNIPTFLPITLWLATDRTGGLWFTEENGNKLGFLDTRNITPPFTVRPSSFIALVAPDASTSFTLSVTNLSPNPIKISAGVENTYDFFGPVTNLTIPVGESRQVIVEMSSAAYLLAGNYTLARLAPLVPVIKVTDGEVNYPIGVLVDVNGITNSNPFGPTVLLEAGAVAITLIATVTGTMLLYNRKKNNSQPNSN